MDISQKITLGRDASFTLTRDAVDNDEAQHWSHYNGAFSAMSLIIESGGTVPEPVVESYMDTFRDWEIDPHDYIDPTCDECSISSEDATEWCGNCGNCKAHCADFEGCDDQCYCPECCSEGHCSCATCNEPCTCA